MENGSEAWQGIFTTYDGEHYEGDWKDDLRHGMGQIEYKNGDSYKGNWVGDYMDGMGEMVYNNGDRYKGAWVYGDEARCWRISICKRGKFMMAHG